MKSFFYKKLIFSAVSGSKNPDIVFHKKFKPVDGFNINIFSKQPPKFVLIVSITTYNAFVGNPKTPKPLLSNKNIQFSTLPGMNMCFLIIPI